MGGVFCIFRSAINPTMAYLSLMRTNDVNAFHKSNGEKCKKGQIQLTKIRLIF
jgi:hypothetical protein